MAKKICKSCGFCGKEKKSAKGSLWAELFLWFAALITLPFGFGVLILFVALGYSLWRFCAVKERFCPKCRHDSMIPLVTPEGKKLWKECQTENTTNISVSPRS